MKNWLLNIFKRKQVEMLVSFFNINTMLLSTFIEIVVDNKIELIVQSGKPSNELILEKWDELYLNYSDLIGDSSYSAAVDESRQIAILQAKVTLVSTIMKLLLDYYIQDYVDLLSIEYGLEVKYYEDKGTYYKQFKRIEARLKAWSTDIDLLILKQPKSASNKPIQRETFDNILVQLEEHRKYHIDSDKITVSKFAIMIKDLKRYNDALEKQSKKNYAHG